MGKKVVDVIRRTGNAQSPTRYIEVIRGSGKSATREVLGTAITKIKGPEHFRHGAAHVPMEQYGFQVGAKSVERFADAAALVLRKHRIVLALPKDDDVQEYVKKAYRIIDGKDKLRILKKRDMAGYKPAVEAA